MNGIQVKTLTLSPSVASSNYGLGPEGPEVEV
jgi:hypothetical protein